MLTIIETISAGTVAFDVRRATVTSTASDDTGPRSIITIRNDSHFMVRGTVNEVAQKLVDSQMQLRPQVAIADDLPDTPEPVKASKKAKTKKAKTDESDV